MTALNRREGILALPALRTPNLFWILSIASDEKKINASVLISFTALRRTDLVSGTSYAPVTQLLGLTVSLLITHFTLSQVYRGSKALYNHDNGSIHNSHIAETIKLKRNG